MATTKATSWEQLARLALTQHSMNLKPKLNIAFIAMSPALLRDTVNVLASQLTGRVVKIASDGGSSMKVSLTGALFPPERFGKAPVELFATLIPESDLQAALEEIESGDVAFDFAVIVDPTAENNDPALQAAEDAFTDRDVPNGWLSYKCDDEDEMLADALDPEVPLLADFVAVLTDDEDGLSAGGATEFTKDPECLATEVLNLALALSGIDLSEPAVNDRVKRGVADLRNFIHDQHVDLAYCFDTSEKVLRAELRARVDCIGVVEALLRYLRPFRAAGLGVVE